MKNYRLYELTDFVLDDDFIRWVQDQQEADNHFWKTWLDENPDKQLVIAEAKRLVQLMPNKRKSTPTQEVEFEVHRLLDTIGASAPKKIRPFYNRLRLPWGYAAAAILIAVAVALFLYMPKNSTPGSLSFALRMADGEFTERVNESKEVVAVHLPDGSIVELAGKSKIRYRTNFQTVHTRDIYLSGEAFFKVMRNPDRPFRVFTNEIVTKVLGTSFSVCSYDMDTVIRVTVRTGKVSVYNQGSVEEAARVASNKLDGMILTPNQQLVYERSGQKFKKILLDNPLKLKSGNAKEIDAYEDAPLERVFGDLEKLYGIKIIFDEEMVSSCTVSADLSNESFYEKLDLICRAVGAEYRITDGQILVETDGCK